MQYSPEEAKRFFVEKILEQAKRERVVLSDIEQRMLHFTSEREAEFLDLNAAFEAQYDQDKYEEKISGLLSRAYDGDCAHSTALNRKHLVEFYRAAYRALSRQDTYLGCLVEMGLGAVVGPQCRLASPISAIHLFPAQCS